MSFVKEPHEVITYGHKKCDIPKLTRDEWELMVQTPIKQTSIEHSELLPRNMLLSSSLIRRKKINRERQEHATNFSLFDEASDALWDEIMRNLEKDR
jgi:hypothetical protein